MRTVICVIVFIQTVVFIVTMIPRQPVVQKVTTTVLELDTVAVTTATPPDNDTLELFLADYEEQCERHFLPKRTNFVGSYSGNRASLCLCIPDRLGE